MTPLWKLSGEFAGWFEDRDFYDTEGNKLGLKINGILSDCKGNYLGEVLTPYDNEDKHLRLRVGYSIAGKDLKNPPCDSESKMTYQEPLDNIHPIDRDGYYNPTFKIVE